MSSCEGGLNAREIAKRIDHTLLKADASEKEVKKLCDEALKYEFYAVCVNPYRVPFCVRYLKGSGIKVCSVIAFPLGASPKEIKAQEAKLVAELGVDEIDYVINVGAVKDDNITIIRNEMDMILDSVKPYGVIVKAIVEIPLLSMEEVKAVCKALTKVDFLKTSTGLYRPVMVDDVRLLSRLAAPSVKVKAAGGIRTCSQAFELLKAGAERLGSSKGVEIMKSCKIL